jgi:hypothetical protein
VHVHSDLWLDQPDAHDRIVARRAADALTADEAEKLHGFVDNGYMTTSLGLDEAFCDALDDGLPTLPFRPISDGRGRSPTTKVRCASAVTEFPICTVTRHGLWPSICTRRSFAWWS